MIVRPETCADHAGIHQLTSEAFAGKTYSDGTEAEIIDRLRAAGALSLSLVVLEGSQIVGHVALSPAQIGQEAGWFCLGPISVAPARQGQGIGGRLMRAALEYLTERAAKGCVLVGDPGYYHRFGFVSSGVVGYADTPRKYVQCYTLRGAAPQGELVVHPAFEGA